MPYAAVAAKLLSDAVAFSVRHPETVREPVALRSRAATSSSLYCESSSRRSRRGELRRSDIGEWDSLKHVEIVFALEDEFGVQFDESEFAAMDSPAAIAALLRPRLEA